MNLHWIVAPLLALTIVALMLWAPGIKWLWLRVLIRTVGGLAGLFIFAVVGFGALLVSGGPKPQYRTVYSPAGLHQATLRYQAGFLGRDSTTVKVKNRSCCQHFTAYVYDGPSNITGTTMTWLDDSHLQIQFRTDPDRYQRCNPKVADVIIICKPLPAASDAR